MSAGEPAPGAMPGPAPDAVVFPGQGAQRPGMGADVHERYAVARATFAEASEAAGDDLASICFGSDPRLRLTEYTQPCLLTVEIAAYRVAVDELGLDPGLFGGHSLGEYTALVAAGAVPFADAVRLVRTRGAVMQGAVSAGEGAMAALMLDGVESSGAPAIARALGAEVTNRNSPAQVVVSGRVAVLEDVRRALEEALPDLEYVPLRVSTPFHSSLMGPAGEEFRGHLEACRDRFRPERAAMVTSNLTGGFHEPDDLVDDLVAQISSPVRWLDNMTALAARAGRVYEVGPRASLTKFFRAIGHEVTPLTGLSELGELAELERRARPAPLPTPASPAAPATPAADGPGPLVLAEELGDHEFLRDHGARLAYVVGGLGGGIGSPALVVRAAQAGLLAFLGSSGLELDRVAAAVEKVRAEVPAGAPWGLSVTADPRDPGRSEQLVDLALRLDVSAIEVAGFTEPPPELVRYRLAGLRPGDDGRPRPVRRLLAKVARLDVAGAFLGPPPEAVVGQLVAQGLVTAGEARLAPQVLVADDVCVDPDPTWSPPGLAFGLVPALLARRDELAKEHHLPVPVRVGVAGGLGTPSAVAAAFTLGADFVVTGSINQATVEAAAREPLKALLATAGIDDFSAAPGGHAARFELGGVTIRSSAAVAAFNRAVRGTALEDWRARHVDDVASFLMTNAAARLDEQARRAAARASTRGRGMGE